MNNEYDLSNQKIQKIAEYWDAYSPEFDEAHNTENLNLWKQELERAIGSNGRGKILDIGTGTGFLALMLAEMGYQAIGVDIADAMMDIGRKKAADRNLNVDFVLSTGEQLPYEGPCFDAVVNCRVLWTLMDPIAATKEWIRVLKPGGKVISFMRIMQVSSEGRESFYSCNGMPIELPLRNATEEDYLRVYAEAGLVNNRAEKLPAAMSVADMPGWSVFIGEKA